MKFFLSIFCLLPFFSLLGISSERHYQKIFAEENKGLIEVPMSDGTRCDVLTEKHAIEVDFAPKWSEAIGQSLNYARLTSKRAGIVLIIKKNKDEHHLDRVLKIIENYNLPIDIFSMYTK